MTIGVSTRHKALTPPKPPSHFTLRSRLIQHLNHAAHLPLTIVASPAGTGKTTLLCSWAEICPLPVAWLTLEEGDDPLDDYVRLLVAAIQTLFPEFGRSTLTALNGAQLPPTGALAMRLATELAALAVDFVVIIDDYEVVSTSAVHQFMRALLPRLPSSAHFVIASRRLPPFPLARLRAQEAVLDLSAADLRFDRAEAQALLEQAAGRTFAPDVVDEAVRQTEGWAVALCLMGIALRDEVDPSRVIARLSTSSRSEVLAFFMEEVYSQQPAPIQEMLLRSSILERLHPSLVEAVTEGVRGEWTGQAFLDSLLSTNLLAKQVGSVEPIVADDTWLRYHALVQTALQNRLRSLLARGDIETLHRQAGAWFERHSLIDEAILHYLAAGAPHEAVRLVEGKILSLIAREDWLLLERWVHRLPPEDVARNPVLSLCEIWISQLRQGHGSLKSRIDRIEQLLQQVDDGRTTWSKPGIELLLADIVLPSEYFSGNLAAARQWANRAQQVLDPTYSPLDAWIICHLGITLYLSDSREAALDLLHRALSDGTQEHNTWLVMRSLFGLLFVHGLSGDLISQESVGQRLLQIFSRSELAIGCGWANHFLGMVYYEWNQLDQARHHLEAVVAHRHEVNHRVLRDSVFALALVDDLEGKTSAGDELLESFRELAESTAHLTSLSLLASFRARRAARLGDTEGAAQWLRAAQPTSERTTMVLTEVPELSQATVLVASGRREDAREALDHLTHLHQLASSFSNTPVLVKVLALTALAHRRLGNEAEALAHLEQAVRLGQPGRFTRSFLDLGPDMASLLRRWTPDSESAEYVAYLLSQFASSPSLQLATDRTTVRQRQVQAQLIEPLTEREQEILALLAERLSYQEIAQRLVISPTTVKTHAHNIYEKLSVNSRADAIEKTERLGLLVAR